MNKLSAICIIVGVALLVAALFIFVIPLAQPTPTENPQPTSTPIQTSAALTATPKVLWWGNLTRRQIAQKTVTITNTGTQDTQPLHMSTDCTVGEVRWNLEGVTLHPQQSAEATILLIVNWNAPLGTFNAKITVTG